MIVNPIISGNAKKIKQCMLRDEHYTSLGPFRNNAYIPIIFEEGMTWRDWMTSPYYVVWTATVNSSTKTFQIASYVNASNERVLNFSNVAIDDPLTGGSNLLNGIGLESAGSPYYGGSIEVNELMLPNTNYVAHGY